MWRGQIVHNAYLDENTTITSRVYASYHRRDRYQLVSTESEPSGNAGEPPFVDGDDIFFGEDTMFGRLRTFRHLGGEVRGEWANQSLLGFRQDFQAGIRYEYQDMTNKNVLGRDGQILENGDKGSVTFFDRSLRPTPSRPSCSRTSTSPRISTSCRASASSGTTSIAATASSPLRKAKQGKRIHAR